MTANPASTTRPRPPRSPPPEPLRPPPPPPPPRPPRPQAPFTRRAPASDCRRCPPARRPGCWRRRRQPPAGAADHRPWPQAFRRRPVLGRFLGIQERRLVGRAGRLARRPERRRSQCGRCRDCFRVMLPTPSSTGRHPTKT